MAETARFARFLRRARDRAGLTQSALADRCRLTGSYISLLESGRKPPPSDEVIRRLATVLRVKGARALRLAHLDRAPEDLRGIVDRMRRRLVRERELRARASDALLPLSVWTMGPYGGGRAAGPPPPAAAGSGLQETLGRLLDLAAVCPDFPSFRDRSREFLEAIPEAERTRILEVAPDLVPGRGPGAAPSRAVRPASRMPLLAAPPADPSRPGEGQERWIEVPAQEFRPRGYFLPSPDTEASAGVRAGDLLLVDGGLEPRDGDLVLTLAGDKLLLRRHLGGAAAPLGVVAEFRRRLRT